MRKWSRILVPVAGLLAGLVIPASPAQATDQSTSGLQRVQYSVHVAQDGATTVTVKAPNTTDVDVTLKGHTPVAVHGDGTVTGQVPGAAPQDWVCTTYSGAPTWTDPGHVLAGFGAQSCSGSGWAPQRVRVAVQWHLFLGVWSNRARDGSPFTNNSYTDWTTYYDCTGTGTHTYRTVVDGYKEGGAVVLTVASGSEQRTCAAS